MRVEWNEVVNLLAGADETNRQIQLAGDGHDDAAFRGAVELGEHDAGDTGVAPEFARLVQAVLTGGRVEHEQHVVRGAGDEFGGGAFHFLQLGHQVGFCVQAAGGVDDDHICAAGLRCGERVVNHGRGIGSGFLLDDDDVGAPGPDFQLFDGGGAKGVGGGEDHGGAFFFPAVGELADGGGLAGAVDADDENDARVGEAAAPSVEDAAGAGAFRIFTIWRFNSSRS